MKVTITINFSGIVFFFKYPPQGHFLPLSLIAFECTVVVWDGMVLDVVPSKGSWWGLHLSAAVNWTASTPAAPWGELNLRRCHFRIFNTIRCFSFWTDTFLVPDTFGTWYFWYLIHLVPDTSGTSHKHCIGRVTWAQACERLPTRQRQSLPPTQNLLNRCSIAIVVIWSWS